MKKPYLHPQMQDLSSYVASVFETAHSSDVRSVTMAVSEDSVVRLSKVSFRGKPSDKRNQWMSFVLSVGKPNARDRERIKREYQRIGVTYPIKIVRFYKTK